MYAAISSGTLQFRDGIPSLKDMQDVVGGYIERADSFPSPSRPNHVVDVYCNEEGLLLGLPIEHRVGRSSIAGNLVVAVSDDRGETVEGREDELWSAFDHIRFFPAKTAEN